MKRVNHAERQTFSQYDGDHHLLYLDEQEATFTQPHNDEPVKGYSYEGDMSDGATIIEAVGITDENRRRRYIAGLIGKRFSLDAQMAILANGTDTEDHAREFQDFAIYRAECKQKVDELLHRR